MDKGPAEAPASVASAPQASAPVTAPPEATPVAPPVAQVVEPPVTPPATPPATPAAFDPAAALRTVVAGASAERTVKVETGSPRLRINKDLLNFSLTASHAGYVYVHMVGTAPNNFFMLFPNEIDKNNKIKAGETFKLPRKFKLAIEGPAGQDHLLVILSDVPRDFSALGKLKDNTFLTFSSERVMQALQTYSGTAPLFAGVPKCPNPADCSTLYGASMFSVEEYAQ
jgi:hypothetical protein